MKVSLNEAEIAEIERLAAGRKDRLSELAYLTARTAFEKARTAGIAKPQLVSFEYFAPYRARDFLFRSGNDSQN